MRKPTAKDTNAQQSILARNDSIEIFTTEKSYLPE
jgi:hypothetical protein